MGAAGDQTLAPIWNEREVPKVMQQSRVENFDERACPPASAMIFTRA